MSSTAPYDGLFGEGFERRRPRSVRPKRILGLTGPDYDLSALEDLIAWRDEYRERNGEVAAG